MTPMRISPIHDQLQAVKGTWREINGMPAIVTTDEPSSDRLGIADLSFLGRFGVKGSGAATWLEQQNLPVPDRPNSWRSLPQGGLIARLGLTEFLIEDSINSTVAPRLAQTCQQPPANVYPVLRQDLAIALCGSAMRELLLQTCGVNFGALSLEQCPVILTSIVGVSVTVIPGESVYRIWCDGTYGAYLWETLVSIAKELGGGIVGCETVFQLIQR